MSKFIFLLFLLCFVIIYSPCDALNCEGCVPLDVLSFDKVISKFPVSLVKFDIAYPYGDKHDQFAQVAKDAVKSPDLFVGEVGIKDYGEKENSELGERFEIERDDFPAVIGFVKNNIEGSIENYKFGRDQDFTAENLKMFIKEKSGLRIPMKGCVEELDNLAENFVSSSSEEKQNRIKLAEEEINNLSSDQKKSGEMYIKVMKKVSKDGEEFVTTEDNRLRKLLKTKLNPTKKEEMEMRLNILQSFQTKHTKDEL